MLKRLSFILFAYVCLSGTAFAQDPGQCVITGKIWKSDRVVAPNVTLKIVKSKVPGHTLSTEVRPFVSGSDGTIIITAIQGAEIYLYGPVQDFNVEGGKRINVPVEATANLGDLYTTTLLPAQGLTVRDEVTPLQGLIGTFNFIGSTIAATRPTAGVANITVTAESPLTFTAPLARATNTISIPAATGSVNGYLSSTDWTTFNNKQAALGYTPVNKAGDTMTGLLILSGNASSALHAVPKQQLDAAIAGITVPVTSVHGRTGNVVSATNDYSFAQIGSKPTTLAGYGITDAQGLDSDLTIVAAIGSASQQIRVNSGGTALEYFTPSASGGTWGSITGTLSNQADLQSALDAKQASLGFTAENAANKATGFGTLNDTLYPSVQAVKTQLDLKANLTANTFTRLQTITQSMANEGILTSTGYSLTGSNAQSLIDLSGTLNTTGVVSVIKANITNTASGSGTKLLDLQVGGVSQLVLGGQNGASLLVGSPTQYSPFNDTYLNSGYVAAGVNGFWVTNGNTLIEQLAIGGLTLSSNDAIFFHNNQSLLTGSDDTSINRPAPMVIGLGNGNKAAGGTFRAIPDTPAQITANVNDYTAGGGKSYVIYINSDAARNITGLALNQVAGEQHQLCNNGAFVITLTAEDAASTAANRLKRNAGNYAIPVDECVGISYDGTALRWRIVN